MPEEETYQVTQQPAPSCAVVFDGPRGPLFKAMAEARKHFHSLTADSKVKVELKGGGGYSHAYADLDAVITALSPGWLTAGLAVMQFIDGDNLTTIVASGDSSMSIACPIPRYDTPQQMGSAVTYIRRYQLKAVFCVNDSEDDDGNAASGNKAAVTRKEPTVATAAASGTHDTVVKLAKDRGLSGAQFNELVFKTTGEKWKDCNESKAKLVLAELEGM